MPLPCRGRPAPGWPLSSELRDFPQEFLISVVATCCHNMAWIFGGRSPWRQVHKNYQWDWRMGNECSYFHLFHRDVGKNHHMPQ